MVTGFVMGMAAGDFYTQSQQFNSVEEAKAWASYIKKHDPDAFAYFAVFNGELLLQEDYCH